ncbi:MAG: M24 family metallopeptidase [Alphaproteobacteria bacterium]
MARDFKLGPAQPPALTPPEAAPPIRRETYAARVAATRSRMAAAGLEALVVYGDREHAGNIAWLTGYDPRFEEALAVLLPTGDPVLMVGNEGVAYAAISPLALDVKLCQSFSLIDQDRSLGISLADVLAAAGLKPGMTVGLAGWKTFAAGEAPDPARASELPAFIVEAVRDIVGGADRTINATALFMAADGGLRTRCEPDQIAAFEFAACRASQGVLRAVRSVQPGKSEHALAAELGWVGQPLNYHPVVISGPRTALGLASPSGRRLERGDPVFMTMGGWGANSVRAGYVASGPADLPAHDRDWLEAVLMPYYGAVVTWYEGLRIGAAGGDIVAAVEPELTGGIERAALNPGHLIHIDEWVSSPFVRGGRITLKSGMALQMDIIPVTRDGHFGANAEDGVVLADAALRAALARDCPDVWQRMQARRAFAVETLGIALAEEVLPLSDILGWVPPWLMDPEQVLLPA